MSAFDFDAAAKAFYDELFAAFPSLERLFQDKHRQSKMFVAALRAIYHANDDDPAFEAYLKKLGEAHKGFGLQRVHIDAAQHAFTAAIKVGDPDLPAEKRRRLIRAFTRLRTYMGF